MATLTANVMVILTETVIATETETEIATWNVCALQPHAVDGEGVLLTRLPLH